MKVTVEDIKKYIALAKKVSDKDKTGAEHISISHTDGMTGMSLDLKFPKMGDDEQVLEIQWGYEPIASFDKPSEIQEILIATKDRQRELVEEKKLGRIQDFLKIVE